MLKTAAFLAQADNPAEVLNAAAGSKSPDSFWNSEMAVIIGAIVALTAVLFLFVYLFRRTATGGADVLHRSREPDRASTKSRGKSERRRRVRRGESLGGLPRNPTLAETGGLPPPRTEPSAPTLTETASSPTETASLPPPQNEPQNR